MSAKQGCLPRLRGVVSMLVMWMVCAGVQARDWKDAVAAPFVDPLRTRPAVLEKGWSLPGDTEVVDCDGSRYESTKLLTLSDAIDLALCQNPQVQSTWAGIKVQAAQVGEARAAYLPTLTAGASYLNQKTQYPESKFQGDTQRKSPSEYYTLTWRLLDFGTRGANHRSASALLQAALASHDAMLQKTIANVIGLYFDAQTALASRDAKEANEARAGQVLEAAQKRETRGVGAQSDTLQARTALAKAELEHARAIGVHEKSLVALTVALGLRRQSLNAQGLRLAPDYQDENLELRKDLSEWLRLAQEQHPAILAARAQLESVREKLSATQAEGLPTLDFTHSQYSNGRPNQGLTSTRTRESTIGITLNIPLFDGFARGYKVRGAQAQVEIKQAELQDRENQVLGDVSNAYADAVSALRNLQTSKRLLDAAQEALKNVQRRYEKGISDIVEMLNVQNALADATQERIRTLAEWRSARLRLLANAGTVGITDTRGR